MFNNWNEKDKCILVTKSNKGSSKEKVIMLKA